eukprot:6192071-Pleurochrysis_carterae.AAC.1
MPAYLRVRLLHAQSGPCPAHRVLVLVTFAAYQGPKFAPARFLRVRYHAKLRLCLRRMRARRNARLA